MMQHLCAVGSLSFGVGGPQPMLTLWEKTRSSIQDFGEIHELPGS